MKNNTTQNLVTIAQYINLVEKKTKNRITPQALHARKMRGAIEFVIGGDTPEYKIDITKYPPGKYKKENRGRKKTIIQT